MNEDYIFVFKKDNITFQFALIRSFDSNDNLNLWLKNTLENKEELLIFEKYKTRQK